MGAIEYICGDAMHLPLADQSVDAVIGSPPYTDRRTYGRDDMKRGVDEWVQWMIFVTHEALRISRGPVLWVVNGGMKDHDYQPAAEGLIWELRRAGVRLEHPLIWSKNAAPNRRDWWCNGYETVVAAVPQDGQWKFDWTKVAKPQKYKTGGTFRQRSVNGQRKVGKPYVRNALARPYDVIRATVGGGRMGHPLAHQNEAPFPESLIEQILPAIVPVTGIVLDPFAGSGTTGAVAKRHGCRAILVDIRESQLALMRERLGDAEPTPNSQQVDSRDYSA